MGRELALWVDALEFDRENGEDGPEVIRRKIADLKSKGAFEQAKWWNEVGRRLAQLYMSRADPPR
ncbi:hypothetical protein [Sphingomonas sp.]|uniref:DUF6961 family protein n=1 Tax=Sphingomonas sp. TaxID=28214 RepID=UPI0031CE041C